MINKKQFLNVAFRSISLSLFLVLGGCSNGAGAKQAISQTAPTKLIALGWDKPDTATLRKNLKEMEQTPFSGVIVDVTGKKDNGEKVSFYHAFNGDKWEREWFQSSLDDLKAIQSDKLTDNFIQVTANPGSVDFFDDEGWAQIIDHMRIAAWIAKEGGLKGISFDAEAYKKPYHQFSYAAQPQQAKHTFEEYVAKSRERGRQMIEAIAAVDPNLIIFTLRLNSDQIGTALSSNPALAPDPQEALRANGTLNLFPAFINGWLDAAPPSMIFVEGTETLGYLSNSELDFLKAANGMRKTALRLVAPENRQKYRAQVRVSFGIYLDGYTTSPTSTWYIEPKGLTPTQRLGRNVHYAAEAADQYVWVYGERYRWWPTDNKSVKPETWEEALPGINEALYYAVRPRLMKTHIAATKIAELKKLGNKNLVQNGDFAAEGTNKAAIENARQDWKSIGNPQNWGSWQSPSGIGEGTFAQDDSVNHDGSQGGAARMSGIDRGVFIQGIDVKPGEKYAVRAWMRQMGHGVGSISITWQTAEGKWTDKIRNVMLYPQKSLKNGTWQPIGGVVTVPEHAGHLILQLAAGGQHSPESVIWFDDVEVYKVAQ